ncbi:hypothetical protein D3C81_1380140 [compost metagenome]
MNPVEESIQRGRARRQVEHLLGQQRPVQHRHLAVDGPGADLAHLVRQLQLGRTGLQLLTQTPLLRRAAAQAVEQVGKPDQVQQEDADGGVKKHVPARHHLFIGQRGVQGQRVVGGHADGGNALLPVGRAFDNPLPHDLGRRRQDLHR